MTKQNPDKLCKSCKEFDYAMNRRDGISSDMLVVCNHEEELCENTTQNRELIMGKCDKCEHHQFNDN